MQVQLAMDHWSGRAIHTSRANQIVDCSSVVNVYPRMKNLESICDSVGIKVPLDHIETKKSELSTEATRMAFGEVFLLEHGVAVDSVVSNGNLTPSEGGGIESYAITEFSDIARSAAWVKESVIDCFSIFSGGAISTPLKGQQVCRFHPLIPPVPPSPQSN